MKTLRLTTYFLSLLSLSFLLASCEEDTEDPFLVTQAQLDASTNFITFATGGDEGQGHTGPTSIGDSTYREIYAGITSLASGAPKGTVVTKRIYNATPTGEKGDDLLVLFAMVKRESGYSPSGGDWEFIKIAYDASVDYSSHPNGILPDVNNTDVRGQMIDACANCHSGALGGDYLFAND